MKFPTLLWTLAFTATVAASAADKIVVVPVVPVKSAPIDWEEKKEQTIEGQAITGDLSVRLWHCSDITISACDLGSLELVDCQRMTIRNCWIHDSARVGISISECKDVRIEGCRLENVSSGLYAVGSQQVRFEGNFFRNAKGPMPRGQMVQFDDVSGAGNVVRGNYAINEHGKSHHEDVINVYMSHGTAESPIVVEDNYLVGDAKVGSQDMSTSGSGIMLADCGGAYITCRGNVVDCAGQCGIGVAGGQYVRVEDNLIHSTKSNVSNVGLYIWNQSKPPSDHVALLRNRVQWMTKDDEDNSWWNGGGITEVEQEGNTFGDEALASEIPSPPSTAPMPPHPWTTKGADGTLVARLPWGG